MARGDGDSDGPCGENGALHTEEQSEDEEDIDQMLRDFLKQSSNDDPINVEFAEARKARDVVRATRAVPQPKRSASPWRALRPSSPGGARPARPSSSSRSASPIKRMASFAANAASPLRMRPRAAPPGSPRHAKSGGVTLGM